MYLLRKQARKNGPLLFVCDTLASEFARFLHILCTKLNCCPCSLRISVALLVDNDVARLRLIKGQRPPKLLTQSSSFFATPKRRCS